MNSPHPGKLQIVTSHQSPVFYSLRSGCITQVFTMYNVHHAILTLCSSKFQAPSLLYLFNIPCMLCTLFLCSEIFPRNDEDDEDDSESKFNVMCSTVLYCTVCIPSYSILHKLRLNFLPCISHPISTLDSQLPAPNLRHYIVHCTYLDSRL